MRAAGLTTIHQTLSPDAASILTLSIAEASRRNHTHTTPLHVASTLLSSPSGYLRQACIKSHPNSSHPLQCRALELCFSVALERLPTTSPSSSAASSSFPDAPVSNALMAALKRAQAHQRRGCPEHQQQPLLAVKVELEQLVISILDDPGVSRVMREARFSSPAVKATIEQSLNGSCLPPSDSTISTSVSPAKFGTAVRQAAPPVQSRSLYLNPRLQQQQQQQQGSVVCSGRQGEDEVNKVVDVLMRGRRRNPVLVGETEPESVVKELLRKLAGKELGNGLLRNVEVLKFDKEFGSEKEIMIAKLKEFADLVAIRLGGEGGVVIDLGDLKWLVEQPPAVRAAASLLLPKHQQSVSDKGRLVVAEVGKLLARLKKGNGDRVWLIGTATCETYLRCQVYHPSMENDWDLQAVPITARAPGSGLFPRLGANPSTQPGSLSLLRSFVPADSAAPPRQLLENLDPARRTGSCPECTQKCEQEVAKLAIGDAEKSPSKVESEAGRTQLPQWLRNAKLASSSLQKTLEIQSKWKETCLRTHPAFHQPNNGVPEKTAPMPRLMTGFCGPKPLLMQQFQPKPTINRCFWESLQLNLVTPAFHPQPVANPPRSPVQTELVLGPTKDQLGVISSEPPKKLSATQIEKLLGGSDIDSFKKLLKGLVEKVWWQREAASAIATIMTQCKLGTGKQRRSGSKGDTWLLFAGPDRVGKRKMALALSEQVCQACPMMISFGSRSITDGAPKHHGKSKPKKQRQPHVKKQVDLTQFRSQLDALGLKLVQVKADRNCFFRSVRRK
ncbi:hypothetical protein MLD38_006724 [Melastoma candidum]|uniref:Uncharacterized protein n=1 Tax=Melastoma candidum TaxID=119954 RepID=A0ACB9RQP4_9MYRT|nr:hypothetical protein MLD38_006724 [Melastoma candidum]